MRRSLIIGSFALLVLAGIGVYVFAGSGTTRAAPPPSGDDLWPGAGAWTQTVMDTLTLEEKTSQLFAAYAEGTFQSTDDEGYQRLVDRVERFGIGGVIMFQSDPMAQATLLNDLQKRSALPLLVSQDMEWGAGMRVDGATTFPRPMAVGATREPAFAHAVSYVTAREARALGTHHVLAPVADVNNNPDNPIINVRSFGEEPGLVSDMVSASVHGLQKGGALATAKHFPGHGDTDLDSHADVPLLPFSRQRLQNVELAPFRAALSAGVKSVMTGHLALPEVDSTDQPATFSKKVTTQMLRDEMGFEGLVITDALNMAGVTKNLSPGEAAVQALAAGADIILMSEDPHAARAAVMRAVENGRLDEARIDESVERILRAKEGLGLHRNGSRTVNLGTLRRRVAARSHRALAGAIARRSLTLLRNEGDLLPILDYARPHAGENDRRSPAPRMLSVALTDAPTPEEGNAFARRLRRHVPDSLLTSHVLDKRARPEDYRTAAAAADSADVILVPAFLNVRAWSGRIKLSNEHQQFLQRLIDTGKPVALIAFGNPYLARGLAEQPAAYLAAYGSSDAVQDAAIAALFGRSAFSGTLPVTIPGAYDYGAGLELPQTAPRHDPPEAVGMRGDSLQRIDSLMHAAIDSNAFPGAAVAIGREPATAMMEGFGYYTYDAERPVTPRSRYDLASLTKVIVTTTAAMQLYEAGRLALDDRVAQHLPAFAQHDKGDVTIRQLLTHSAGLPAFRPYTGMDFANPEARGTRRPLIDTLLAETPQYEPGAKSEYSDLGMVVMGLVIEEITGQSLARYAEEHIFEPLGMERTGYRPVASTEPDTAFVPTEREGFRGELLQGEVHDPTAFLMGGVSGNAGVFSTTDDLATFAYMLLNEGRIYGEQFLEAETIETFTTRAEGLGESTRALGWDTKTMDGYSSAGSRFGPESFGHTGFTGTSLWIDPEAELFALLLTNRVYPKRTEDPQITRVRPTLADLAYGALAGPPVPLLPGTEAPPAFAEAEE
jgi:beta-glucosidase-like glycosyl hydrolase/CubicO group peptidase (beta-lactamase class C family)